MKIAISRLIFSIFLVIAGCRENPAEAEAPMQTTSSPVADPLSNSLPVPPTQGDNQMTPSQQIPADAGLQNLIDKAMTDLAQRLSIPITQIALLEARPVVWPDASLGCPQPGMAYTQVQVDGLLIRLQAGEQIYEYHSGGIRDPFLCVKTVKDPNPSPQIDIFNLTPKPNFTPDSASTPDSSIPPEEDE